MNRTPGIALTAAGFLAAGAIGATLVGTGVANGTPARASKPATFQMFANVDAEGDLGSHHGATKVKVLTAGVYAVTFSKPVGHCAAMVQAGRAGGPDQPTPARNFVINRPGTTKTFEVDFFDEQGNTQKEPFMMTVTCKT